MVDRAAWSGPRTGRVRRMLTPERSARQSYPLGLAALAVATGAMLPFRDALGVANALLIYLLVVFALALTVGAGPAAAIAVVSFLLLDFFFIPPYSTFTVGQGDHLLALFVYLGVAVVTSQLVARIRVRTEVAEREQRRTTLLYELNAALVGDVTIEEILGTIVERVIRVYGAEGCRILLPGEAGTLAVRASFPPDTSAVIERGQLAVAEWALAKRVPAGIGPRRPRVHAPHGVGAAHPPPVVRRGSDILYLPIATAKRTVGVLEVRGGPGGGRFGDEDERILTSFAMQAALALERGRLTEEAARSAVLAQSDELKSALLAAVSHDLRMPLAVIKASATSLLDPAVAWGDKERTEFLTAIDEETDRLTLMVGNLLDLSRIEGGVLRPDREWYDIAELIEDAAVRLAPRAEGCGHRLETRVEPDLPLVWFDYVEIAQVLMNLGENAFKYTPRGTPVEIGARLDGKAIEVSVRDGGPGIPARDLPRIFDKFHRIDPGSRIPGSGIGLAICKGLV
ncbi:MAG: DUF4118 domain-containing protein, partial [Thermomicrobiales bacterium]